MADIRINALPTTATDFASDDYIAIDGTTNGTRKLNAKTANLTFGDVTFGSSGPSAKSSIAARAARQGLVFDGTAGATVASVPAFGSADFTFAAWVNQSSLASAYLCSSTAGPDNAFMYLVGNGTFQWWSNVVARATSSAGTVVAGKWNLLVASRTGGTVTLYSNGVSVGSGFDSQNITSAIDRIGLRANTNASILNGAIVPLIYNRALSAAEVVALYESGVPAGADYNTASNTNIITGDSWYNLKTGSVSSGTITLTSGQYVLNSGTIVAGKRYRVTYNVTALTGTVKVGNTSAAIPVLQTLTSGAGSFEFTANDSVAFGFNATSGTATITSVTFVQVGLLLAPDAGQAGGGLTWYDTSGNAANITWTSGVSWNVPSSRYLGGNWTTSGNLTVSGGTQILGSSTGVLYFGTPSNNYLFFDGTDLFTRVGGSDRMVIKSGGNVLVGTTTDSANGKLQLATHTTSAGGIGLGTDISLYRSGSDQLALYSSGTAANLFVRHSTTSAGGLQLQIDSSKDVYIFQRENRPMYIGTNNTTALTLDSSQNATFAGTGVNQFAGNLNIKGGLGAHQTAALNLAYEGSSVSQAVAYGADASTLGTFNVVLRKAGTGTGAVTGLGVRDYGIITQGGTASTPASASATGSAGTISWDASYIYVCTAANTWKRVAIATW